MSRVHGNEATMTPLYTQTKQASTFSISLSLCPNNDNRTPSTIQSPRNASISGLNMEKRLVQDSVLRLEQDSKRAFSSS